MRRSQITDFKTFCQLGMFKLLNRLKKGKGEKHPPPPPPPVEKEKALAVNEEKTCMDEVEDSRQMTTAAGGVPGGSDKSMTRSAIEGRRRKEESTSDKGGKGKKKKKKKTDVVPNCVKPMSLRHEKSQPKAENPFQVGEMTDKDTALVQEFVKATLIKGVNGLRKEFKEEKRGSDFSKMKTFVLAENKSKNRYKDVGCLEDSRVVLRDGRYIHANFVRGLEKPQKFICTQGPLPGTISDFWHMVVEASSSHILMLCNFKEQNMDKCACYYPTSVGATLTDVNVTVLASHIAPFVFYSKNTKVHVEVTVLDVTLTSRSKSHRCTHLHWKDWPDRGVPPSDAVPIELCRYLSRHATGPIVVHCSAGIGRTGSIVLIDLLVEEVVNDIRWKASLLPALRELRGQRNNSVQTEEQWIYVHMVALNFVSEYFPTLRASKDFQARLHAFCQEYEKQCLGFGKK